MLFPSILAAAALSAGVSAAPQYSSSGSGYSGSNSGSSSNVYSSVASYDSGSTSTASYDSGSTSTASYDSGSTSTASYSSGSYNSGSYSGSSNSGYSSSSGYYGSSSDSGCSSDDCGSNSTDTILATSVMMTDSTSIMMTETALATSIALATSSYSIPSYGSGSSSSWSDSGYDGCVQQCIASYGSPGIYAPTATSGSSGSTGTGATYTVIVAPSEGVLRYVPFAVNASVGDTIQFMWGANEHTVTKSSELTPCNKTSDAPFASGEQNASFVFSQVVNDTNPTFFYCGTPTHCEKGMFGIINPPSAFQAPTSVSGMMSSVIANDTTGDVSTYASYTANQTAGTMAAGWGSDIDMSSMPSWAYEAVVENVMFTRNVLAMNPDVMNADGSVDLAAISSTPLMVPPDVGNALAVASAPSSSAAAGASSATSSSTSSASASPSSKASNGALSVTSHKALVGAMVLVATYFAL